MDTTGFTEACSGLGVRCVLAWPAAFVKRSAVASLDSRYRIFAFERVLRVCNTFIRRILSLGFGSMDASPAVVPHSKAFVVARIKLVVPKQRRIERLAAGYAIQEFRNDSQGSYWYVVTALEVIVER